jgi:ABC-2 type transport system permease protein
MTRLVKAELLKLRTTRTARTLLALAAAGTAALVALVLLLAGRPGQPELGADALRQLVLVPAQPLTLAALVLGILGMAGEFRHGTATSTFLVTPVRGRVVAAKLAAAAAGLAMALVASATVFAVGLPWLRAKGIEVTVADAGLLARVAGLAAAVALFAVLGVGLAALLRNQVAAVIVGLLWWSQGVERILVAVLHQPGLERWLPRGAASALTAPGDATLPMWAGGLVFAAYGLVLALAGGRLVARRDLT